MTTPPTTAAPALTNQQQNAVREAKQCLVNHTGFPGGSGLLTRWAGMFVTRECLP